jgi:hypothetical protein
MIPRPGVQHRGDIVIKLSSKSTNWLQKLMGRIRWRGGKKDDPEGVWEMKAGN